MRRVGCCSFGSYHCRNRCWVDAHRYLHRCVATRVAHRCADDTGLVQSGSAASHQRSFDTTSDGCRADAKYRERSGKADRESRKLADLVDGGCCSTLVDQLAGEINRRPFARPISVARRRLRITVVELRLRGRLPSAFHDRPSVPNDIQTGHRRHHVLRNQLDATTSAGWART